MGSLSELIRELAHLDGLDASEKAMVRLLLEHCATRDWHKALDVFEQYFMQHVLVFQSRFFDIGPKFHRIQDLLRQRAASGGAAASSPPAKKAKKSLRGTKACPVCGTRWGTRKKKCDKCGYQFRVKSKSEKKNDGSTGAVALSSSEPEETGPFDLNGFYPLYNTERGAAAAGDGTTHLHDIDGVTYYMPNGIEYYHGNHAPAAEEPDKEESAVTPTLTRQTNGTRHEAPNIPEDADVPDTSGAAALAVDERAPAAAAVEPENTGEAKEGEVKEDVFDSPPVLNTSDVVEIRLKPIWRQKLFKEDGQKFVRGKEGDDKKAVQKIHDILTKKNVKKILADFPVKSVKSWQNKQIRTEWKQTRDTKPPQTLDESDPLVVHWRNKQPPEIEPLPIFMPEDDGQFLVEDMSAAMISVYLEDTDDSGNFKFKFKSDILLKYVEWRQLPDLPVGAPDDKVRFQAALDCLHTFGGAGRPFHNDSKSIMLLSDYASTLDKVVHQAQKALDKRIAARESHSGGEFKDPEMGRFEEELARATGVANWDRDPPLEFDASFVERVPATAAEVEQYLEDEHVQRQLFIRQWAVACAMLQMPDGSKRGEEAQLFEIKFEGDPTWYAVKVVRNDPVNSVVEYAYVNPPEDGQDWSNAELDFALDTFRLVEAMASDDGVVTETSIEEEDAEQIAQDEEEDDAESSEDEGEEDELMGEDVFVEYVNASGDLMVGKVLNRRLREDVAADDPLRVTDPYEYDVDGVWVGSEHLSQQDGKDYETDDDVTCPDGVTRKIESTGGDLAFFEDYAGDDGVTFDELDEAKLAAVDAEEGAAAAEEEKELHEVDTQKTRKWRGRTVRVIEPLEPYLTRVKAEEKTPPFNLPYTKFSDAEWKEKKKKQEVSKDDDQIELVDLQDVSSGEIFREQIADELDQDHFVAGKDSDDEVDEDEMEEDEAAEQEADDAVSSDDAASSEEEDEPESEPEDDILVSDAGQETDAESGQESDNEEEKNVDGD